MDADGGEGAAPVKPRPRASVVGVLGEVFITFGVLVFLFFGWQVRLNDLIVGAEQNRAGTAIGEGWDKSAPSHQHAVPAASTLSGNLSPGAAINFGEPVVGSAPRDTAKFAVLYVPRFGADYARSISEGVETAEVLDKNGIGHYPDTQMPGQVGNFAIAAHRTTHGAPFKLLANLQVGDKIYVRTPDGYYTYGFRGLEYVRPTGVGVLSPTPQFAGAEATDRILTMTSCNPEFSAAERIIAYAALESWQPTSAGAPAAISAAATAKS